MTIPGDVVASPQRRGRVAGLDVLRGVAVLLVVMNHAHVMFAGAGVVGVTIFFVLSGYLITGILTSDVQRTGRVHYWRFFRARMLRLYPPLLFMLAGFVVVEGVLDVGGQRSDVPRALVVALTYTSNLTGGTGFDNLFQLWSLAVEWQFYLVWPVVIALVLPRIGRLRTLAATGVLCLLACAATIYLSAPDTYKVYGLPTSWSSALIAGGALRLLAGPLRERYREVRARRPWVGAAAVTCAAAPLAALCFLRDPDRPVAWIDYLVLVPGMALAAAVLVFAASEARVSRGWMRPLVLMGTVSYAVYLWDLPLTFWLADYTEGVGVVLPGLAAIVAATVCWWLVEKPSMAWRRRLDRRQVGR